MPKYNIETRNASHVWDTFSIELPDHTAARGEAAKFVGNLLQEHADKIWIDQEWQIDVTDEAGLILYVMNLSVMQSAATQPDESNSGN
ncbi:DUF6894 family protein [Sphingomonas qomolangmaensis]|uniref:DUF6894 domain-containing protein n=1 Tax=Sphingomonas qomolangmaensis TaxID=2918765 RepID=A0ABY5LAK7_9SPHN|nr:hypothetical protein [Sphingomonas qomolangmaensis]UUL83802.1 hypothetical protein NMP03_06300 [Sphingomonas qomolangmaensis]